ncbi:hypothetical protein [Homoserinibacter sp. GY 40078]|uniref:hypothetical protein n=1 Tax=Homoserinibacter sp. GY 40078 TaxID=2603275 RepID=UPI0011C90F8D|nr:hypothetical protein [Homoserinibacter sp. GY 40078]TXK18445.1 hypothetical protein FVQ89_00310 [Homoserinibacter sp. GY 40078]
MNIRQWIEYRRAWREFEEVVQERRRESNAQIEIALAELESDPSSEHFAKAARLVSNRLGFDEQVSRVVHLDPERFCIEVREVTRWNPSS